MSKGVKKDLFRQEVTVLQTCLLDRGMAVTGCRSVCCGGCLRLFRFLVIKQHPDVLVVVPKVPAEEIQPPGVHGIGIG